MTKLDMNRKKKYAFPSLVAYDVNLWDEQQFVILTQSRCEERKWRYTRVGPSASAMYQMTWILFTFQQK